MSRLLRGYLNLKLQSIDQASNHLRVVISTIFFFPLGTSYTISGLKIRLDGIAMPTILVVELVRDFLMGQP